MCNRIEDLIEKARHYQDLWHEALDENARLKEEAERYRLASIRVDVGELHAQFNRALFDETVAENARLKAEVEQLSKPAIIGGYNLSQYIRMANSETLEFDNGDIFAGMTLPERIKYIVESHARLRSVAEDNKRECEATRIENARLKAEVAKWQRCESVACDKMLELCGEIKVLKAEVERLAAIVGADAIDREHGMCCDASDEVSRLKAEVERLTKAGDKMAHIHRFLGFPSYTSEWESAKEGKQSK